jgi:nitroreductase
MNVQTAIATRLSIRRYTETAIPTAHMQTLFKALQLAPSANNQQNREFVFAGDPQVKKDLIQACMNQKFVGDCSYFIAAVADPGLNWHSVDIAIALSQFSLQAVELGYGTCWIGAFDEAEIKNLLDIPNHKKVVVCMTLGKPEGRHMASSRKDIGEFVYSNRYGTKWTG